MRMIFKINKLAIKSFKYKFLYKKERSAMTFVLIGAAVVIYIGVGKHVMKQATAHLK